MGAVFALYSAWYYWVPKMIGVMYNITLGKIHFWIFFIGVNVTFFPQHFLGLQGMPRRISDYPDSFAYWNLISSLGSIVSVVATWLFLNILYKELVKGKIIQKYMWNLAQFYSDTLKASMERCFPSLEWGLDSPPKPHAYESLPSQSYIFIKFWLFFKIILKNITILRLIVLLSMLLSISILYYYLTLNYDIKDYKDIIISIHSFIISNFIPKNTSEYLEVLERDLNMIRGITGLSLTWTYNLDKLEVFNMTPLALFESTDIISSKPREIVPTILKMESDNSVEIKSESSDSDSNSDSLIRDIREILNSNNKRPRSDDGDSSTGDDGNSSTRDSLNSNNKRPRSNDEDSSTSDIVTRSNKRPRTDDGSSNHSTSASDDSDNISTTWSWSESGSESGSKSGNENGSGSESGSKNGNRDVNESKNRSRSDKGSGTKSRRGSSSTNKSDIPSIISNVIGGTTTIPRENIPNITTTEESVRENIANPTTTEELDRENMRDIFIPRWLRDNWQYRVIDREKIAADRRVTSWVTRGDKKTHDPLTCEHVALFKGRHEMKSTYDGLYNRYFGFLKLDNGTNGSIASHGYGMPPAQWTPTELTPMGEDNPNDTYKGLHGPGFRETDAHNPSKEDEFCRLWNIPTRDQLQHHGNPDMWEEATAKWFGTKQCITNHCSWTDLREEWYKEFLFIRKWYRNQDFWSREDCVNSDVDQ